MMSMEEKLRENLKAAADALIVPQPKQAVRPIRVPTWRHGLGYALAAAAAVVALAVPALLLWSGGGSPSDVSVPETTPPVAVESTDEETVPPTTTPPETTTSTAMPPDSGTVETLDEITVGDHRLTLVATLIDEREPQTATVVLRATPISEMEPVDEAVIGTPAAFFWHTVTGEGAVCEFSAEQTDTGANVTVKMLLSPSIGCSDPYRFILDGDDLSPKVETPEDVAWQFFAAWEAGDEETMADLAEANAISQTEEISPPREPMFSYCEGAAGSVYCTFEVVGGELVIRVRSEPPSRVTEVRFIPDN